MRLFRLMGAIKHPYTEYKVKKAKKKHISGNPECAVCGLTNSFTGRENDVHHKEPVHVNPERACDPDNLVTMCRPHHWLVGHFKNWKKWNKNIDQTVYVLREAYDEAMNTWEGK